MSYRCRSIDVVQLHNKSTLLAKEVQKEVLIKVAETELSRLEN